MCWAKSNQGGIETRSRAVSRAVKQPAKSNQGGIETRHLIASRQLLWWQNRTKVGLKRES